LIVLQKKAAESQARAAFAVSRLDKLTRLPQIDDAAEREAWRGPLGRGTSAKTPVREPTIPRTPK
jgi:hypothetical protein